MLTKENFGKLFFVLNWTNNVYDVVVLAAFTERVNAAVAVEEGLAILFEKFTPAIGMNGRHADAQMLHVSKILTKGISRFAL